MVDKQESTRERLLTVAAELFAEKGYAATSTKEICEKAGANIAAIHYHFESKEKLLAAILSQFQTAFESNTISVLKNPNSYEEFEVRLSLFMESTMNFHRNNRNIMVVAQRDVGALGGEIDRTFGEHIRQVQRSLVQFLNASKKKDIIRADIDSALFSHLILTTVLFPIGPRSPAREFPELNMEKDSVRKHYLEHQLRALLTAVNPPASGKGK